MNIWDIAILGPIINVLIALSHYLFGSFGLAIIVLTLIIRLAMLPLTLRQLRASKKLQDLQGKLAELQKKYARDQQKLAAEQMKLYRESGISPLGCLLPMLIQMPIWIALYQSIIRVSGTSPDSFLSLSSYLYSWDAVYAALPVDNMFIGMNLAYPNIVLALLVGVSMWVQQKMTTPLTQDPNQRTQGQGMLIMMPLMFTFLSITFPSGLALYWLASNIFSIILQYFISGWGSLRFGKARPPVGGVIEGKKVVKKDEGSAGKRQDGRRSEKGG